MADSILTHFSELPDPRSVRGRQHELSDILTIAICGVICGAESWTEIEQFGGDKERWFRTFLKLPSGIPSHDTFGRVRDRRPSDGRSDSRPLGDRESIALAIGRELQ